MTSGPPYSIRYHCFNLSRNFSHSLLPSLHLSAESHSGNYAPLFLLFPLRIFSGHLPLLRSDFFPFLILSPFCILLRSPHSPPLTKWPLHRFSGQKRFPPFASTLPPQSIPSSSSSLRIHSLPSLKPSFFFLLWPLILNSLCK